MNEKIQINNICNCVLETKVYVSREGGYDPEKCINTAKDKVGEKMFPHPPKHIIFKGIFVMRFT